jgi:sporulation protein YlmC with PRC-barrel domain
MVTTFEALRHLPVIDSGGEHLGRVVDLELEPEGWQVRALIVRLERAAAARLGLRKLFGQSDLALRVIHVHAIGDAVLLRDSLADLARIAPEAHAEAEVMRP